LGSFWRDIVAQWWPFGAHGGAQIGVQDRIVEQRVQLLASKTALWNSGLKKQGLIRNFLLKYRWFDMGKCFQKNINTTFFF